MSDAKRIEELSAALEAQKVAYAELQKIHEDHATARENTIKQMQETIDAVVSPEAIYSITLDRNGGAMVTVRSRHGESGDSFLKRLAKMRAAVDAMGLNTKPQIPAQPNAPVTPRTAGSVPVPAPAPGIVAANGTTHCVLMQVGKTYKGDKAQLAFTCEGIDEELKYSKANVGEFVTLLSSVGQWTPAHFAEGAKYPVDFLIDWELGKPNDKGKQYYNVVKVHPK